MSVSTWIDECYPRPAGKCPADEATADCLRKWTGTRPAMLKKHGVVLGRDYACLGVTDGRQTLWFGMSTCALCHACACACDVCPIRRAEGHDCSGPYGHFGHTLDPEPMIALLERTLAWEQAQKGRDHGTNNQDVARRIPAAPNPDGCCTTDAGAGPVPEMSIKEQHDA